MTVASAKKNDGGKDGGKTSSQHTPGRKGRTGNQYFEVGKVGRKTGITLKDTGIRDEYGMEPVSGIFSSPVKPMSPPKRQDTTLSSGDMAMQESSAPDVDETLHMRKTPRLPPPRASTPKHTNIGSPRRMSSARQQSRGPDAPMASDVSPTTSHAPPNRLLNFNNRAGVRMSIEDGSPFKPRRTLRRSTGGATKSDPFVLIPSSDTKDAQPVDAAEINGTLYEQEDEDEKEQLPEHEMQPEADAIQGAEDDEAPPLFGNDEDDYQTTMQRMTREDEDISEAISHAAEMLASPSVMPSTKRKRGRPRKSGDSVNNSQVQHTPTITSGNKRDRTSFEDGVTEDAGDQSISQTSVSAPSAKRPRGRPRKSNISVHSNQPDHTIADQTNVDQTTADQTSVDQTNVEDQTNVDQTNVDQTAFDQTIDPQLLAHGDSYLAPVNEDSEVSIAPSPAPHQSIEKPTKTKAQRKPRAPKERDANISIRHTHSPTTVKLRPVSEAPQSPSRRATSVSNVNLRASTPFEDAHQNVSRSGRPILKPLKHWAGESYVWKNGQVEGVIRADDVVGPTGGKKKGKAGKRRGPRAGARAGSADLDSIAEEESETESTVPDEWEESVGVIAGTVAAWDPVSQQGNSRDTIREDLAFAASSIVTREVANSAFQYAKINTLPFFGSGVVELAPQGFKRAKNSRKMQMVFFVHEGKVLVTVGPPPSTEGGGRRSEEGVETNEFAISKGGVWVVPRGNNYSITNESRTRSARIFFAQGCEIEAEATQG